MLEFSATKDDTRQSVLNSLQSGEVRLCHASKQPVAVVKSRADQATCDGLGDVIRQRFADVTQRADVEVAGSADVRHMLVE